jgi:hypothetical protein
MRSRAMRDRNRQLGAAYDQSQLAGSDYNDNWMRMQMQQQQNLAGLRSQTQADLLQPWQLANQTRQINQQLQLGRAQNSMQQTNLMDAYYRNLGLGIEGLKAVGSVIPG